MPPKAPRGAAAGDGGDGRKQPTAQEAYLFYTIIKNMKGKPEIDWQNVALDNNFKNAETAKVRYGQIKRKLGLDNWGATPHKTKEANDGNTAGSGEDGFPVPDTPTPVRSKKVPSTPTAGTGAGVKKRAATTKRAANPNAGGRGRKASLKAQAAIKLEDDDEQDDDEDDDMVIIEKPNKVKAVETELNASIDTDMYANFPQRFPPEVLRRHAILVNEDGNWVVTATSPAAFADWLARLPANIQANFYAQEKHNGSRLASNTNNHDLYEPGSAEAAIQEQLLRENLQAQRSTHGPKQALDYFNGNTTVSPAALNSLDYPVDAASTLGYLPNNANNNRAVDLHSIPMHPDYAARLQLEREQGEREQEEREHEKRDAQMLFGGDARDGDNDFAGGWI
ncbi:hypothetical protein VTK26DRAFT_7532 [Humicola hyalothermophila]